MGDGYIPLDYYQRRVDVVRHEGSQRKANCDIMSRKEVEGGSRRQGKEEYGDGVRVMVTGSSNDRNISPTQFLFYSAILFLQFTSCQAVT